eukprot:527348_1
MSHLKKNYNYQYPSNPLQFVLNSYLMFSSLLFCFSGFFLVMVHYCLVITFGHCFGSLFRVSVFCCKRALVSALCFVALCFMFYFMQTQIIYNKRIKVNKTCT